MSFWRSMDISYVWSHASLDSSWHFSLFVTCRILIQSSSPMAVCENDLASVVWWLSLLEAILWGACVTASISIVQLDVVNVIILMTKLVILVLSYLKYLGSNIFIDDHGRTLLCSAGEAPPWLVYGNWAICVHYSWDPVICCIPQTVQCPVYNIINKRDCNTSNSIPKLPFPNLPPLLSVSQYYELVYYYY